jgi:uncharacterized protein (TIGR00725 family)
MNTDYRWDPASATIVRDDGHGFDPWAWNWTPRGAVAETGVLDALGAADALRRLAAERECRRVPVGVIGPRDVIPAQYDVAEKLGRGLGELGLTVICGGRSGVMEAVAKGARSVGGLTVGLLPDHEWRAANDHIVMPVATGLSEARNMIIAKSSAALIAVGNSFGTLSEVAYGLHFGKLVIGLAGAAEVEGVRHVGTPEEAVDLLATHLLGEAPTV